MVEKTKRALSILQQRNESYRNDLIAAAYWNPSRRMRLVPQHQDSIPTSTSHPAPPPHDYPQANHHAQGHEIVRNKVSDQPSAGSGLSLSHYSKAGAGAGGGGGGTIDSISERSYPYGRHILPFGKSISKTLFMIPSRIVTNYLLVAL